MGTPLPVDESGDSTMKIEEIKIKYPTGFEHAVHMTKEEMEQHIRLMAALKMFELGKISSGKAAEWGMLLKINSGTQQLTIWYQAFFLAQPHRQYLRSGGSGLPRTPINPRRPSFSSCISKGRDGDVGT